MSPAATTPTKKAPLEILMVANASGETIKVSKPKASRSKAKDPESAEGAAGTTKAKATKAKATTTKAATTKSSGTKASATKASASKAGTAKSTTTKAAAAKTTKAAGSRKPKADAPADLDAAADQLLAAAGGDGVEAKSEKDAKAAKALASIKVGPKGVYTEDSIRVYLQEIGRIRLLRPDEEIELARKIADLLQLEELAAQFETDNGHYPDTKEWAALVRCLWSSSGGA